MFLGDIHVFFGCDQGCPPDVCNGSRKALPSREHCLNISPPDSLLNFLLPIGTVAAVTDNITTDLVGVTFTKRDATTSVVWISAVVFSAAREQFVRVRLLVSVSKVDKPVHFYKSIHVDLFFCEHGRHALRTMCTASC